SPMVCRAKRCTRAVSSWRICRIARLSESCSRSWHLDTSPGRVATHVCCAWDSGAAIQPKSPRWSWWEANSIRAQKPKRKRRSQKPRRRAPESAGASGPPRRDCGARKNSRTSAVPIATVVDRAERCINTVITGSVQLSDVQLHVNQILADGIEGYRELID